MGMLKKTVRLPYRLYLNLFQAVELRLFRLFRIKMFVHYQGDDARQGSQMQGLEYSLLQGVQKGYYSDKSDQFKASQIERISKFTEKVFYVNPDLSRVLPGNSVFIPYSHVDLGKFEFVKKDLKQKKIRIVHAPSNRGAKGTNYVLEAMLKIQLSHPEISFELVENLSHERALEIYRDADLVIDQLLAGWYGGLAVEALAIGVPVMCYLREDDFNKVDPRMIDELPIINVTQSTLVEKILDFIAMSDLEIEALRRAGRIYVEKWHSIDEISEEILNYYYEAHKSNQ
jgi:glycosyltransferase involved in cell wall biosynthesis